MSVSQAIPVGNTMSKLTCRGHLRHHRSKHKREAVVEKATAVCTQVPATNNGHKEEAKVYSYQRKGHVLVAAVLLGRLGRNL